MSKNQVFQIFTIIAVIGMICWYITDYFGGMIIHLFQYAYIIIPIVLLYFITVITTLIKFSKSGIRENKVVFGAHLFFIIFILSTSFIESDMFKSKVVLRGVLKDDLCHYTLTLREDGSCENEIQGFLGFKKIYYGNYKMNVNRIIFSKKPYDNDFLPDTLYLDKAENAIFLYKNAEEKQWLNHFELIENN